MDNSNIVEAKKQANLRALQRMDASVADIIGTATHVVLYQFNTDGQKWEKSNIEGSLFITKLSPDSSRPALCSFAILNRTGVDNLNISITPTFQMQLKDPYLIFRDPNANNLVRGIWFHDGQERSVIGAMLERIVRVTVERDQSRRAAGPVSPSKSQSTSNSYQIAPIDPKLSKASQQQSSESFTGTRIASTDASSSLLSPMQILGLVPPSNGCNQTNIDGDNIVLNKKQLQETLLSLIQDQQFIDVIHAQYLKSVKARKK